MGIHADRRACSAVIDSVQQLGEWGRGCVGCEVKREKTGAVHIMGQGSYHHPHATRHGHGQFLRFVPRLDHWIGTLIEYVKGRET